MLFWCVPYLVENISKTGSPVRLLMSEKVVTVGLNVNALELARLMKKNDVRNIFVKDGRKYVGVVRDIDLVLKVIAAQRDPKKVTARDIMRRQLPNIDVDAEISEIAKVMFYTKTRRAIVTEKGKVIGSITAGDLLRLISFVSRGELESFLDAYKAYLKSRHAKKI